MNNKHLIDIKHEYDFDLGWILYFIAERQSIMLKKNSGLPKFEWTEDAIFSEYRFCNVDREDDRVTTWLRDNIREPFADHPDLWLMLALSRWINWPPMIEELVKSKYWFGKPEFSLQGLADTMLERHKRGEKVYTASYMINTEGDKTSPYRNKTKHEFVCCKVVGQLLADRDRIEKELSKPKYTLEAACNLFQEYSNWGGFMAYELVTDLNHTRYLENAPDRYIWSNQGIGANRGMNRLTGKTKLEKNWGQEVWNEYSLKVIKAVHKAYDEGLIPNHLISKSQIDARCIESAHCEMDKYLRVKNGEGRPRSKYNTHSKFYAV